MLTIVVLLSGLTTMNDELLVSRTIKLSLLSCAPSCRIVMFLQNRFPKEVPLGRSTTSLVRGVKSSEAIKFYRRAIECDTVLI